MLAIKKTWGLFSMLLLVILLAGSLAGAAQGGFSAESFIDEVATGIDDKSKQLVLDYDSVPDDLDVDKLGALIEEGIAAASPYQANTISDWQMKLSSTSSGAEIELIFNYHSTLQEDEKVFILVTEIMDELLEPGMNIHYKLKEVVDYISENVEYDFSLGNHSAYSALKDGQVTCQGYSLLTHLFLEEMGIENIFIDGELQESGLPHVWNLVLLGDDWFHLDVTQISYHQQVYGKLFYNEYLVSDKALGVTHNWERQDYPEAGSCYLKLLTGKESLSDEKRDLLIYELNLHLLQGEYTVVKQEEVVEKIISTLLNSESSLQLRLPRNLAREANILVREALEVEPEAGRDLASWSVMIYSQYLRAVEDDQVILEYDFQYN